jgi:threonine dehydrogenase-like Zn-dependent dehydrogenase
VKANCWIGPHEVEVVDVPDPRILNARDAIVKITSTAICGSDLHLLDGCVPTMQVGDIMGHEFMGEVVEGGRGPDACIDAVGMEATHGAGHVNVHDRVTQAVRSETDRPHALRQAIMSCRSGGIVSVIGVYGGLIDTFPAGAWMNRALTLRTGQCHVQRYMRPLLQWIERGEMDPTRVITHRLPLAEAPHGDDLFKKKVDGCEKVVLTP